VPARYGWLSTCVMMVNVTVIGVVTAVLNVPTALTWTSVFGVTVLRRLFSSVTPAVTGVMYVDLRGATGASRN